METIVIQQIEKLRERRGLNKKEFAEKLNMSPKHYGDITNGKTKGLKVSFLLKVAKTFKVEPSIFFSGFKKEYEIKESDILLNEMAVNYEKLNKKVIEVEKELKELKEKKSKKNNEIFKKYGININDIAELLKITKDKASEIYNAEKIGNDIIKKFENLRLSREFIRELKESNK